MILPSIAFAAESYEGKSQAEINKQGKDFAKGLNTGAPTSDANNGILGTSNSEVNTYQNIASNTYNTNVIPSSLGKQKIQKCTSMTQDEVNTLINSSNAEQKMLGIDCDAIRTNEKTNDLMETRRIDPKKDSLITTFNENQKKAVQTDENGKITITCNTVGGGSGAKLEESCIIVAAPTVKTCKSNLVVTCVDTIKNKVINDRTTECGSGKIGVDPDQRVDSIEYNIATGGVYANTVGSDKKFFVIDKDKAIAKGGNFIVTQVYASAGMWFTNGNNWRVNGTTVYTHRNSGTRTINLNVNHLIKNGWNSLSYLGISSQSSISMNVPFLSNSGDECNLVCTDVWDMTCTEELMKDDGIEDDGSIDYDEDNKTIY
jgi:hypothetical protein